MTPERIFRRREIVSSQRVPEGRAALILNRIGKGSCETHGKRSRIRSELVVGFREGLHVFDGDFDNECPATDILLGPGDLCSHVILVERRHFDVQAFCHGRSPNGRSCHYTRYRRRSLGRCVLLNAKEAVG
jgi:hypothetical protein